MKKLWEAFETLQAQPTEGVESETNQKTLTKLEAFLKVKLSEKSSNSSNLTKSTTKLDVFLKKTRENKFSLSRLSVKAHLEIDSFVMHPVPVSTDVLQYWNSLKYQYPYLYILAMIVIAVPTSQTSVERLFSSMNFVFSDRRGNLDQDNLENIVLIRTKHKFKMEIL